jgi:hypothetical protein
MDVCLAHSNSSGKGKNLVSNSEVAEANALLSSTPLPSRLVRPSPAPSVPLSSTPPPFPPLPPPTPRLRSVSGRPVPSPYRRDVVPLLCARASPPSPVGRAPIDGAAARSGRGSCNRRRRRRMIWPLGDLPVPSPRSMRRRLVGPLLRARARRPWTRRRGPDPRREMATSTLSSDRRCSPPVD